MPKKLKESGLKSRCRARGGCRETHANDGNKSKRTAVMVFIVKNSPTLTRICFFLLAFNIFVGCKSSDNLEESPAGGEVSKTDPTYSTIDFGAYTLEQLQQPDKLKNLGEKYTLISMQDAGYWLNKAGDYRNEPEDMSSKLIIVDSAGSVEEREGGYGSGYSHITANKSRWDNDPDTSTDDDSARLLKLYYQETSLKGEVKVDKSSKILWIGESVLMTYGNYEKTSCAVDCAKTGVQLIQLGGDDKLKTKQVTIPTGTFSSIDDFIAGGFFLHDSKEHFWLWKKSGELIVAFNEITADASGKKSAWKSQQYKLSFSNSTDGLTDFGFSIAMEDNNLKKPDYVIAIMSNADETRSVYIGK